MLLWVLSESFRGEKGLLFLLVSLPLVLYLYSIVKLRSGVEVIVALYFQPMP